MDEIDMFAFAIAGAITATILKAVLWLWFWWPVLLALWT